MSSENIFTYDYFIDQARAFREMMGSKGFTIEQRADGFKGLAFCVYHVTSNPDVSEKDRKSTQSLFEALTLEYEMRMKYIVMMPDLEKSERDTHVG